MHFVEKESYTISDLVKIVEVLRSPTGCPWDRAQTHESIRKNFIEETYEAVEAIDTNDSVLLKEELGDVLLQIILHSQMEAEAKSFSFDDVCDGICRKLLYRHPHVFGNAQAANSDEALASWEEMKRREKRQTSATQTLTQVSSALPALMFAEKVQKRAAKVGFDYETLDDTLDHLFSEIAELKVAIAESDEAGIHDELGDVLFSTVNMARFLAIDPEHSLYDSTAKFVSRFSKMEALLDQRGINLEEADLSLLNCLWEEVKDKH